MIEVFIDESGNQGKRGKYFIISAVVCSEPHSKERLKRIFKKACLKFSEDGIPLREIKSSSLSFEQLQTLLNKVALRTDHEIFIMALDKKHLKTGLGTNLDYMYLSGVLIKRILKKYNDDITITFDARDVKQTSLTSIADYLMIKAAVDWGFTHKLEVKRKESHLVYCLQAADLLTHVAYRRYADNNKHLLSIVAPRIEEIIEFPVGKFGK
ncbi:MAG: hypothetical protein JWO47_939 [Candidatus Saccharibacteria bacterium]|nr:hypothetical protein [Candidatus Saccharibacteria bacterium]